MPSNMDNGSVRGPWGSGAKPHQPRPHPAQVTRYSVSLAIPVGAEQVFNQVIPHIPLISAQFPPGHPRCMQDLRT